jgi:hypothetical protein
LEATVGQKNELTKCGKFGTEQKSIAGWDVAHTKISKQYV